MTKTLENLLMILSFFILAGCLPHDEQEPLIPYKGIIGSTNNSIYTHQSYFSLHDSTEVANNLNADWDLGFEASTDGEHVILNNSDRLRVANLGNVEFSEIISVPENAIWQSDASSGNFDSLAISSWVNTQTMPYQYSQNVYILCQLDDFENVNVFKKFKLIELTSQYYILEIANIDNSGFESVKIEKNPNVNFVKASVRNVAQIVSIEPNRNAWDIQFSAYEDSIPDDYGKMYYYPLKGAFINPTKIKVALYYITTDEVATKTATEETDLRYYFENDSIIKPLPDSLYSSEWDAFGWEWKDVTIDEAANTAIYKTDTRRVYLIKDLLNGNEYKLRFFSYYSNGEVGYPVFQYIRM